jgi:hypothetical protein
VVIDRMGVPLPGQRETVIQAMAAGNDLMMIKDVFNFDPSLPQNIVRWVREAIERGVLLEKNIIESANRIRRLQQIAGGWSKFSGRAYSNNGTGARKPLERRG